MAPTAQSGRCNEPSRGMKTSTPRAVGMKQAGPDPLVAVVCWGNNLKSCFIPIPQEGSIKF
jgi:hypothetical protein